MLQTQERLNLILKVNENQMDLSLVSAFDAETILSGCQRINESGIKPDTYNSCKAIQHELIRDAGFTDYWLKMNMAGIARETAEHYIGCIRSNNASPLDFSVNRLLSSIKLLGHKDECFYDYLKHFSGLPTNKEQKQYILSNLRIYKSQCTVSLDDLPETEREILSTPLLSDSFLIPEQDLTSALSLLATESGLYKLVNYFYDNGINVTLSMAHYREFMDGTELFQQQLNEVFTLLKKDSEVMTQLTKLWLENNCPDFDLQVLREKLHGMSREDVTEILNSRGSYINFIYGGRLKNIPLSEVPPSKEDVLVYAIQKRKNGFLRLIESNFETFMEMETHLFCLNGKIGRAHV
jgi:hypothetical protein